MLYCLPLIIAAVCIALALATLSWLPLRPWLRRRRRAHELAALLPGPRTLPLIGNFNMFLGLEPSQLPQLIGELADKYDGTFKLKMGTNFSVMMFKPRDVETVLGSTQLLDKAVEYNFLRGWLNEGLLVSRGRKWHKRRKIITPAFHFRILDQYVEIFDRQTRLLVNHLAQARGDGSNLVELGHAAHLCALDVICAKRQQLPRHNAYIYDPDQEQVLGNNTRTPDWSCHLCHRLDFFLELFEIDLDPDPLYQ